MATASLLLTFCNCDKCRRVRDIARVNVLAAGRFKIILSVSSSGKPCSRVPVWRSWGLACARVLPAWGADLHGRDAAVRNGKEKVYGSIP